MALPLPNLDDRTYADLVEDLRSRIPIECPAWTDHNSSDTGIILLELLAWITETVLYRVNQIPDANLHAFLKLLSPPNWQPSHSLQSELEVAILDLRQHYRAVTAADYQHLLLERWPQLLNLDEHKNLSLSEPTPLARVHCLPGVHPSQSAPVTLQPKPGHLTLVAIPWLQDAAPTPSTQLLKDLVAWLEPCRLLTTHHHLIGPSYVRVEVAADLHLLDGAAPKQVLNETWQALQRFFAPLPDLTNPYWDGQGWPLGRSVYPSELYQLLDQVPGVDYVTNLRLWREPATATANSEAPPQPIELQPHELAQIALDDATIYNRFTLQERTRGGNIWRRVPTKTLAESISQTDAKALAPIPLSAAPPPAADSKPDPSPPMSLEQPSYVDYLPAVLQTDPVIDQFLFAFRQVLSGSRIPSADEGNPGIISAATSDPPSLERIISLIHTYFDPGKTPEEFLPWLAGWVALSLQDNWPPEAKRQFINAIAPLYRQRGTKAALLKILQIYLENAGFKDVASKTTITEIADYPNFFQVSLTLNTPDSNLYHQQARIAQHIIDQEKPAHTYYALRILVPTMQIYEDKLILGENTTLGTKLPGD
ncbi:phage tail protein [Leptolyngbya sp. AN02str]|uniref:phage tail protein n=1 Tax=Leptolyngbya sp. AN02str TaxID=3423363 RepID=UPI003D31B40A